MGGKSDDSKQGRRVNTILQPYTFERLERLVDETNASTMTEVIKEALYYYERLVQVAQRGSILLEHSGDQVFPFQLSIDAKENDEIEAPETDLKQVVGN